MQPSPILSFINKTSDRSFGGNSWFGKFYPAVGGVLVKSLGAIVPAVMRGKVNIKTAIFGHKINKPDLDAIKRLYKKVDDRQQRVELNLYVSGYEDDPEETKAAEREAPAEPSAPGNESVAGVASTAQSAGSGEASQSASSESETS